MESAKATASNIAASAKSGMDKTKATVQEKVEKMTVHTPVEKDMATQRKQEKIEQAELNKQVVFQHNAAAKQQSTTTTTTGQTTTVPLHKHGMTGHPHGRVDEAAVGSHQIGTTTTNMAPNDPRLGGDHTQTGYGTGTGTTNMVRNDPRLGGGHTQTGNGTGTGTGTTNMAPNDLRLGGGHTQTDYGTGTGTGTGDGYS
ncbi:late embryogenesis abundant protein 46-like [Telopea speciosissima]|uniref:late embryogenesis abundant protein 46-like n=1 Tax=Telopea speciosissima TaxID=54955 RepID=UPI001CC3FBEC|nr:late embryogenesis abundant protein 46-like [Telopea speciosissima]